MPGLYLLPHATVRFLLTVTSCQGYEGVAGGSMADKNDSNMHIEYEL